MEILKTLSRLLVSGTVCNLHAINKTLLNILGLTNSARMEWREKGKCHLEAAAGGEKARKKRADCRRCLPRRLLCQMLREGVDNLIKLPQSYNLTDLFLENYTAVYKTAH